MLVSANIFQPLIDVFQAIISFFHDSLGVPWGWAIVLLTVCVRLVLIPLSIKQMQSMRRLQQHQPELKALQQKYKDDKQRQQQEVMSFYRENNVNPLASCLPMVLQVPVFISLFYMLERNLRTDICPGVQKAFQQNYMTIHHVTAAAAKGQTTPCGDAPGSGFLFIHDITNKATGITLVILIVLYVGTQLASSMLMAQPGMDQTQRRLMMFLPVIFVFFIIRFPAGLLVYWITTNAWTMAQQYIIRRSIGPAPAVAGAVPLPDVGGEPGQGLGRTLKRLRGAASPGGRGIAEPTDRAGHASNGGSGATQRPAATPPRPPRKKKKRSGRRR